MNSLFATLTACGLEPILLDGRLLVLPHGARVLGLALDLAADRIRVNSISPGWIWTREVEKAAGYDRAKWEPVWGCYHMLQRLGHPIECARAALFLLSDDASFITGTDLPVDGGYQSMGPEGLGQTAKIAGSK